MQRVKIWDPVTRLWHWVLVVNMGLCWAFGEFMSLDTVRWHFYLGYVILGLMVFRLVWGLIGPAPIRLSHLFPRPSALLQYLKTLASREPSGTPGHNPLGALSVVAILAVTISLTSTGLFIATDDFDEYGPLNRYVSDAIAGKFNFWHDILADAILTLVALHVTALLFYLIWKKENLIRPMITGWKWVRRD
ncbi:MAG: cytochrome b/b6 domain-containing protein [Gammaproteobacteria bacterium]|nr:cytochrome b/b6 domain-containing protein [Gammaproteobacteria bacterium]